jgi:hypothetical protein
MHFEAYIVPFSFSFPQEYVQVGTTLFVVQVCFRTAATEGDVKGSSKAGCFGVL